MKTMTYQNFNNIAQGVVITSWKHNGDEIAVVKSRNPYGSHSLVLVEEAVAVRHGLNAILSWGGAFGFNALSSKSQKKRLRKLFLYNKWRKWGR